MNLLDELIDAYLVGDDTFRFYYDMVEKKVVMDADPGITGEPRIDLDDEENEERYAVIPKLETYEAFELRERFAESLENKKEAEKFWNALSRNKPFRRFKDALYETDLWDEWNEFEQKHARKEIEAWLIELEA